MLGTASVTISVLALAVSVITAWLTLIRRGTVRMTRPTQIFFKADDSRWEDAESSPKVYLRALMFATSKRPSSRKHARRFVFRRRGDSGV